MCVTDSTCIPLVCSSGTVHIPNLGTHMADGTYLGRHFSSWLTKETKETKETQTTQEPRKLTQKRFLAGHGSWLTSKESVSQG